VFICRGVPRDSIVDSENTVLVTVNTKYATVDVVCVNVDKM